MSTVREYLAHFFAQGIARVLSTGSALLVFILAARLLSVEEFGEYSLILAYINIFAVLSQFGTNEVMGKAVVELGGKDMPLFFGSFLVIRLLLGAVAIVLALVVVLFLRDDLSFLLLICVLGIPLVSARFFDPVFQVVNRPQFSVSSSLVYSTVFLCGSVSALLWAAEPIKMLVVVYIFANMVYAATASLLLRRVFTFPLRFNKDVMIKIIWLAAPLGPAAFYSIINSRADLFFLSRMMDDTVVGLYSAAYRLVDLFAIGSIMIVAPLIPIFSKMVSKEEKKIAEPLMVSYEIAGFFTIPFALVVPFLSSWFAVTLFGDGFVEAGRLVDILSWVVVLVLFSLLSSTANLALGAIQHGYWSGGVAVTVNVLLNLWWIPKVGAVGAAYATLISSGVWLLISHYYTHSVIGNIIRIRYWFFLIVINTALWVLLYPLEFGLQLYLLPCALFFYLILGALFDLHPVVRLYAFIQKVLKKLVLKLY